MRQSKGRRQSVDDDVRAIPFLKSWYDGGELAVEQQRFRSVWKHTFLVEERKFAGMAHSLLMQDASSRETPSSSVYPLG